MKTIFINIPSYRDPEIWETVSNVITNAEHPERVFWGLTIQTDYIDYDTMMVSRFNNVSADILAPGEIIGAQPGRLNSHKFYNGQDYYLNMDSHMRSIKHWDTKIIEELEDVQRRNGPSVLTAYVAPYDKDEANKDRFVEPHNPTRFYMSQSNQEHFTNTGIPQFCCYIVQSEKEIVSPYVSGHFFFTSGEAVKKCGFVKEIIFTEEEIFMALRFFTAGYNLYCPKTNFVYHRYGRPDRKLAWDDFPEKWFPLAKASEEFTNNIIQNRIVDPEKGLFDARTIEQFEEYSGIYFSTRTIADSLKPLS